MKEKWNKFRKTRIFSFLIILIAISICISVGYGIAFFKHVDDPTDVGSKYLRAFIQQDYDEMYKYVYKKTADVSKNLYKEKMKSLRETYVIDSYDIGKVQNKDGTRFIEMTCTDEQKKEKKKFVVYFAKEGFFEPKFFVDISKNKEDSDTMVNEYKNMLTRTSDNVVNKYYLSVRKNDKKCKDILSLLGNNKQLQKAVVKKVRDNVNSIIKTKSKKKYYIKKLDTSIIGKSFVYDSKSKQFVASYNIEYNYALSTKTTATNSYTYHKKGKRKANIKMYYQVYKDGIILKKIDIKDQKK